MIGNEIDRKEERKKEKEIEILKSGFTREHDIIYLFKAFCSPFPRYIQLQLSKTKIEITLRTG